MFESALISTKIYESTPSSSNRGVTNTKSCSHKLATITALLIAQGVGPQRTEEQQRRTLRRNRVPRSPSQRLGPYDLTAWPWSRLGIWYICLCFLEYVHYLRWRRSFRASKEISPERYWVSHFPSLSYCISCTITMALLVTLFTDQLQQQFSCDWICGSFK